MFYYLLCAGTSQTNCCHSKQTAVAPFPSGKVPPACNAQTSPNPKPSPEFPSSPGITFSHQNLTTFKAAARGKLAKASRSLARLQPLPRQQAACSPRRAWLRPLNYDGVSSGPVVARCLRDILKYSPGRGGTTGRLEEAEGARRAADAPLRQGSAGYAPLGAGRRAARVSEEAPRGSGSGRRPGAAARPSLAASGLDRRPRASSAQR